MKKLWIFLAVCGVAILFLILNPFLHIRRYALKGSKARAKIAVVSDLHSQLPHTLIAKLQREQPDLILLPGDIIDDKRGEEPAFTLLKAAAQIAPTYYVVGNHEVWTNDLPRLKAQVEALGVIWLDNRFETCTIHGTQFVIAGIEDPYHHKNWDVTPQMEASFSDLPDGYKILLAHRPEQYQKYQGYGFDLVVSGHAHGGQWRIPFLLNGLYAPHQGLFPKRAGGMYQDGTMYHMVSRGTYYNFLLRIFNPPEFSIITLTP